MSPRGITFISFVAIVSLGIALVIRKPPQPQPAPQPSPSTEVALPPAYTKHLGQFVAAGKRLCVMSTMIRQGNVTQFSRAEWDRLQSETPSVIAAFDTVRELWPVGKERNALDEFQKAVDGWKLLVKMSQEAMSKMNPGVDALFVNSFNSNLIAEGRAYIDYFYTVKTSVGEAAPYLTNLHFIMDAATQHFDAGYRGLAESTRIAALSAQ